MSERGPVFSVTDTAEDMVAETATPPPGRLPGGVVGLSVVTGALWFAVVTVLVYLVFGERPFAGWHLAVVIPSAIAAGACSANVAGWVERLFGQHNAAVRVAGVSAWLGIGTGGLAGMAALVADYGVGRGSVGVVAVVSSLCLLRAPFAAAGARRQLAYVRGRHEVIAWLRRWGKTSPGVLTRVAFQRSWHQGWPEFTVEIVSAAGVMQAHMVTAPERVPVAGSRVAVTWAAGGEVGVVLVDLADGAEFEGRVERYQAPPEG